MNEEKTNKILRFEDMPVWQDSLNLAVLIYKTTRTFPTEEKFALTDQLHRAASSISANIAEGFGRHTLKDRSHFYYIALGSLLETKNFIYLSEKLCYVKRSEADVIIIKIESIHKQITAILGYFKKHV
jgi:four helix bundle protein